MPDSAISTLHEFSLKPPNHPVLHLHFIDEENELPEVKSLPEVTQPGNGRTGIQSQVSGTLNYYAILPKQWVTWLYIYILKAGMMEKAWHIVLSHAYFLKGYIKTHYRACSGEKWGEWDLLQNTLLYHPNSHTYHLVKNTSCKYSESLNCKAGMDPVILLGEV